MIKSYRRKHHFLQSQELYHSKKSTQTFPDSFLSPSCKRPSVFQIFLTCKKFGGIRNPRKHLVHHFLHPPSALPNPLVMASSHPSQVLIGQSFHSELPWDVSAIHVYPTEIFVIYIIHFGVTSGEVIAVLLN